MPVHMLGTPCDMDAIIDIAYKNDIKVVEDCAEALGAEYKGKKVGSSAILTNMLGPCALAVTGETCGSLKKGDKIDVINLLSL